MGGSGNQKEKRQVSHPLETQSLGERELNKKAEILRALCFCQANDGNKADHKT